MITTNPKSAIIFAYFKIDDQLADILTTATDLRSRIEELIDSKKYNDEEYPGNALNKMWDAVGDMMHELGNIIGNDIASQAFDLCKKEEGGEA